jgi:hypothetical protein
MFVRAGAVWFAIMTGAIVNGAFRDLMLAPRLGEPVARALSCFTLASIIVAVTWLTLTWIKPGSMRHAWRIGATWLAMTLIFEFGAGRYLFGTPWRQLLADYDLAAGRLWILVLIATLVAPPWVFRARQTTH